MRPELQRLIRNARNRQEGRTPADEEIKEDLQYQLLWDFKVFLARKIDLNTRLDILIDADFFCHDSCPSLKFRIDDHVFVLSQPDDECYLWEETGGETRELTRLSNDDSQFEDRLLAALGGRP
jgi:hypothetical protein